MNKSSTTVTIHTNEPSTIIVKNDTFSNASNKLKITVPRSEAPIFLTTINDSIISRVALLPVNSFAFYANIPCTYGLGMLIDKKNPRRYGYPKHVYITSTNASAQLSLHEPPVHKKKMLLHLSLPYINSFYLKPEGESTRSNTGFWGLTAGLAYQYKTYRHISLTASAVSDFFVPVPAAVDISGEYELMTSTYIALAHNHHIKRFRLGYGLSFARNSWNLQYHDRFNPPPPSREPVKKTSHALGLIFPLYYQVRPSFFAGLVYRPTFFNINQSQSFHYQQLISIDFGWRIRL